ncbi:MAG TPA: hypothetical protein EYQ27_09900 [Gemmatimonadetes bacterium]|nr:hypothetical protein [Gemmatimonadota bacterium]
MFAKTWRDHWNLSEDPFAFEDADKDPFVTRVDASAVHSSFDRIFGNADTPAPGIVFGEKGSGKSGLRLAMQRGIEKHKAGAHQRHTAMQHHCAMNTPTPKTIELGMYIKNIS